MASAITDITINERQAFVGVQVRVQIQKDWRVRIGLWILKLGVWLTGAQIVEEFPMSLIQDGQPVEVE